MMEIKRIKVKEAGKVFFGIQENRLKNSSLYGSIERIFDIS